MLNDVTFGQYYPSSSFIHKLDPRIKFVALITFIVLIFVTHNFYSLAACALVILVTIAAARVPFGRVVRSVKGVLIIVIFSAVINLFVHKGDVLLCKWWVIEIYLEGVNTTIFLITRLFLVVMVSSVLTLTTTPVALTDGIESLIKPLKYIKFPVHELALVISIALRMIPTLIDETNRIVAAQKARGAEFDSGNIFKRIKAVVPVLTPLVISAFRRADELGDAMDARCYSGSKNRTKYKKLTFGVRDLIAFLIIGALIAAVVCLNIYGSQIFPQIYQYIKLS